MITVQSALWDIDVETLPKRTLDSIPFPRLPTTIKSTLFFFEKFKISSEGFPRRSAMSNGMPSFSKMWEFFVSILLPSFCSLSNELCNKGALMLPSMEQMDSALH